MRAAAVLLVALLVALSGCDGPPPSDDKLIAKFQAQRGRLEELRQKLCAMKVGQTVWRDDSARPALAPEQRAAFLTAMRALGASSVSGFPATRDSKGQDHPCQTEVTLWTTGMLDSGDDRAFVHDPYPDSDDLVVSDISAVDVRATVRHFKPPSSHGHRRYLRQIEGGWWLSRSYWE